MIGVLVLFGSVIGSRIINDRAMKKLDQDKKAQLIDLFSGRAFQSIFLFLILGLFFLNIKFEVIDSMIAYIIYSISLLAFVVITGNSSYKKLRANDYPNDYIQSYLIMTTLRVIGLVVFFAIAF